MHPDKETLFSITYMEHLYCLKHGEPIVGMVIVSGAIQIECLSLLAAFPLMSSLLLVKFDVVSSPAYTTLECMSGKQHMTNYHTG